MSAAAQVLRPAFKPSDNQRNVFSFVETGRGSAIVEAVAGSGKTTTILECLPLIAARSPRASVLMLAFNAVIAKELKERIAVMSEERGFSAQNMQARTFHSLGFSAVCKRLGKKAADVQTDGKKLTTLARQKFSAEEAEVYAEFVVKLVDLAKGEGIGALVPDTEERWYDLIQHHDLFLDDQDATEARAVELARQLLKFSCEAALTAGWIDYSDQLYLPLLWRLRLWQNDFVFVDEAQDTNPVRRALAKLALRTGGRLIAVGDARQAIYGFTGASHDALDLIAREFNCVRLPLTVSYRCGRSIIEQAQALVPHLEAAPGAADGQVSHVSLKVALPQLGAHDAVLCRNTAPLLQLAYQLIAMGTGCVVLGREIGAGLVSLVQKMRARDVDSLVLKLESYRAREVAKFTAKGEEQKAEAVNDRVDCVLTVVNHLHENERTVGKLIYKIENLFSDSNGVLTLCTAHKAKGREWDTVAILSPELMPSKWARQDWQVKQEENLMYVAWTRARQHLIFIDDGRDA